MLEEECWSIPADNNTKRAQSVDSLRNSEKDDSLKTDRCTLMLKIDSASEDNRCAVLQNQINDKNPTITCDRGNFGSEFQLNPINVHAQVAVQ